jgi:hypothetical protein
MTDAVFCAATPSFAAVEADALPAKDNAPASPNAVTVAFFRLLVLRGCFKRDMRKSPRIACTPKAFNQVPFPEGKLFALARGPGAVRHLGRVSGQSV